MLNIFTEGISAFETFSFVQFVVICNLELSQECQLINRRSQIIRCSIFPTITQGRLRVWNYNFDAAFILGKQTLRILSPIAIREDHPDMREPKSYK